MTQERIEPTFTEELEEETAVDTFEDIEECFRDVVRKYGRAAFALTMHAGMGREAANVLGQVVGKHQSRHGQHALAVLINAFNQISSQLAVREGLTEGLLAQCDRDVQLAFRAKVQVAQSPIILAGH